jgi:hypothetical protein
MNTKKNITRETLAIYKNSLQNLLMVSVMVAFFLTALRYDLFGITPKVERTTLSALKNILFIVFSVAINSFFSGMVISLISNTTLNLKQAFDACTSKVESILEAGLLFGLFITLGFIALIVPGVYLQTALIFFIPMIVIENKRGLDALKGSYFLVKGHWWYVFLSIIKASIIPTLIFSIVNGFGWFFMPSMAYEMFMFVEKVFVFPYMIIVVYVLYRDLKATSS